ncbi:MAG: carboxypeptidase regulatory-like domain-containing protein [Blastocatellia bacterium]|nr:carboxypeptidase regulatory-like domain-containing protein [Blastocatellia bacterium]
MNPTKLTDILLLAAILLTLTSVTLAQGTTSRVTGTVLDAKGAAVPGAAVTLTNEGTQLSLAAQTEDSGSYSFQSIQVGTYTITAEKQGFKKFVSTHNLVDVNQPTTVNVTLEVGGVSEEVRVESTAELVQTGSSGNLGNTIDQRVLETLPIVGTRGRNPLEFINVQPGVASGANTGGGNHVNGARDRAFNFTLDGIDVNETSAGGSNFTPIRTNPDSLAEFQIVTSNFTAEQGRSSGAQVALVTRSGTNDFHGTLFEFYQTPRFNANEYENNLNGRPRGQFVQHIFGGSLGGPLFLPRFGEGGKTYYNGRNRTFFFVNVQLLRATQSISRTRTVLTPLARQGIFRYVLGGRNNPAGVSGASVDANGNPLPGLTIASYSAVANDPLCKTNPANCGLDPQVQALLALTPLPNNFSGGDGLNYAGFTFLTPTIERQHDLSFKIDHTFNERNSVFVRYSQGEQDTVGDSGNGNTNGALIGGSGGPRAFPGSPLNINTLRNPKNLAVNYRWSPTATVTNELVVGFNRFTFSFNNADPNANSNSPIIFSCLNVSDTNCLNVTNPLDNSPTINNARSIRTYQLVDNFSYLHNSHTFKFGTNLRFQQHRDNRGGAGGLGINLIVDFNRSANPVPSSFNLPANSSSVINSTDRGRLQSFVNGLLGRVGSLGQGFVATSNSAFGSPGTRFPFDARYPDLDFYGQDTWKIRSNLTLDYGLRWEARLSPRASGNPILRPDRPVRIGEPPSNALRWVPGKLFDNDLSNFAPSLGLAWDPFKDGKTSIRSNFRIAYDRSNTFVFSSSIFNTEPGLTLGITNSSFGLGPSETGRLRFGLPTLAPPTGVTPEALRQPPPFSTNSITVVDPSLRSPKTYEWAFSLQREIGFSTVIEANYLGRRGVGLYGAYDVNQVDIFNNGFLQAFNTLRNDPNATSSLINQLMTGDPNNNTGSASFRTQFSTELSQGSVAATAGSLAQRTTSTGGQLIVANGFSPFFFQRYPQFSSGLNVIDSHDFSTYHGLQLILKRRFTEGLSFQAGYTLSKSRDTRSFDPTFTVVGRNNAQSASSTPLDLRNRKINYAPSDFDRRHVFQAYAVYDIPFGKGRRYLNDLNPVLDRLLGGFELAGLTVWESGRPFTVYSGIFTVSNVVQAPANCSGCTPNTGSVIQEAGTNFFFSQDQRSKFSFPAPGELGNTGRNLFIGPPLFRLDMTLGKKFAIGEKSNLEFRAEIQNVTNSPSFAFPTATFTSSTFGRIRDGVVSSSRHIQLALKLNF